MMQRVECTNGCEGEGLGGGVEWRGGMYVTWEGWEWCARGVLVCVLGVLFYCCANSMSFSSNWWTSSVFRSV